MSPALLWVDIETSGLNEHRHYLLEIGFKVTDSDLETISEASWVVPWDEAMMRDNIRPTASPPVQAMHEASGLWTECAVKGGVRTVIGDHGFDEWVAGAGITDWLYDSGAKGLPLAGSSVGFDRRWLNWWIPGFEVVPHYRSVDVSTVKILMQQWAPHRLQGAPIGRKLHRALPDLDDSISELAFYRSVLGLDPIGGAS